MDSNLANTMPSLVSPLPDLPAAAMSERRPPSGLLGRLTPAHRKLAAQFLRFGVVGALGFLWDTATVYSLRHLIGLTAAMILAYFIAASMNWLMNRLWTFRGTGSAGSLLRQWGTFLAANGLGFLLNRGTALILVHTIPFCAVYPVLALIAGTFAGMFCNFALSRRLVFR